MSGYNWKTGLPRECHPATVPPVVLEKFEEAALNALRVKGFDPLGKLCYYHHAYALYQECLDEEGLYGESETFRQEITAWRLYTGSWLVRKYEAGAHSDCAKRLMKPRFWISGTCPSEFGSFASSTLGLPIEPEAIAR